MCVGRGGEGGGGGGGGMGSKVLEAQGRRQCSLVCSAELLLGPLEHAGICMRLGGGARYT